MSTGHADTPALDIREPRGWTAAVERETDGELGPGPRTPRPAPSGRLSPPPPAANPRGPVAQRDAGDVDAARAATRHGPARPDTTSIAPAPVTAPPRERAAQDPPRHDGQADTQPAAGRAAAQQQGAPDAWLAPRTELSRAEPPHAVPSPPPRVPAMPVPARGRNRSTGAEETTEVHVHIGRIEVTALQQTPAPRKPPRSGRAPLSLDDYLARRRGAS